MPYKIDSTKKIDKNFKILISTLKENRINYWVCHGTLLGIIRENKLIEWDHDIDIGILENEISRGKIINILKKKGFKEIKKTFLEDDGMLKFVKDGGREVDINFYKIDKNKKIVYVKWYIPRNLTMRVIDVLSFAKTYKGKGNKLINLFGFIENFFLIIKKIFVRNGVFYSKAGYTHRIEYVLNLKKYNFAGLKIIVPKNYLNYLNDLYGVDWRVPKKAYNWIKHSPSTIIFDKNSE